MSGFRRAQLKGSEELFRPTDPAAVETRAPVSAASEMPPPPARDAGHLVRLSKEEVDMLVGALQLVKFPNKAPSRPSVFEFERLEELRQKLLSTL